MRRHADDACVDPVRLHKPDAAVASNNRVDAAKQGLKRCDLSGFVVAGPEKARRLPSPRHG